MQTDAATPGICISLISIDGNTRYVAFCKGFIVRYLFRQLSIVPARLDDQRDSMESRAVDITTCMCDVENPISERAVPPVRAVHFRMRKGVGGKLLRHRRKGNRPVITLSARSCPIHDKMKFASLMCAGFRSALFEFLWKYCKPTCGSVGANHILAVFFKLSPVCFDYAHVGRDSGEQVIIPFRLFTRRGWITPEWFECRREVTAHSRACRRENR